MAKNPGLKRAHSTNEFDGNKMLELKRCVSDPIYFMETYVKVQHPTKGSVPFILYEYQKDMVRAIHENKDTILLCSRQMGKCLSAQAELNSIIIPTGLRRFILKLVDRTTHDSIFGNINSET